MHQQAPAVMLSGQELAWLEYGAVLLGAAQAADGTAGSYQAAGRPVLKSVHVTMSEGIDSRASDAALFAENAFYVAWLLPHAQANRAAAKAD